MTASISLRTLLGDRRGATIVELAVILPVFLSVLIGGINLGELGFTQSDLNYAVEAAARCASINTTTCGSASGTQNYAASKFRNMTGNTAVFVASSAACGNRVTGSVTFDLNMAISTISVPLASSACFPS